MTWEGAAAARARQGGALAAPLHKSPWGHCYPFMGTNADTVLFLSLSQVGKALKEQMQE